MVGTLGKKWPQNRPSSGTALKNSFSKIPRTSLPPPQPDRTTRFPANSDMKHLRARRLRGSRPRPGARKWCGWCSQAWMGPGIFGDWFVPDIVQFLTVIFQNRWLTVLYILVYKDPLLTYLLVSMPSFLTLRYIFGARLQVTNISGNDRPLVPTTTVHRELEDVGVCSFVIEVFVGFFWTSSKSPFKILFWLESDVFFLLREEEERGEEVSRRFSDLGIHHLDWLPSTS